MGIKEKLIIEVEVTATTKVQQTVVWRRGFMREEGRVELIIGGLTRSNGVYDFQA